jgi:hypothetical protein
MVLTSTQSDEDAQHFYRRLGYRDCGVLILPGEAGELMLLKELPAADGSAKWRNCQPENSRNARIEMTTV